MLRHDYSLPERAVGFWASLTLGILALTSLGLRYVTHPISCWMPVDFTDAHAQYSRDACFRQPSVWIPFVEELPTETRRQSDFYTYHQWVPFTLGVAAILCLLPHAIWRMLSGFLWLDVHGLVQTLADNQRQNAAGRHVLLKDSALVLQAGLRGGNWMLTAALLGRKALACVVCVLQAAVVVLVFKPQLSAGDKPHFNPALPEQILCDMRIRTLQNVQHWTLQCMMPLSQVYSKGFTFLFYFFLLLALGCLLDILLTVARLAIPGLRDSRLKRYLAVSQVDADPQMSAVVRSFLDTLGLDGRLVVAVTADVCGPVTSADLTNHLWVTFKTSAGAALVLSCPPTGAVSGVPVSTVRPPCAAATCPPATAPTFSGDPGAIPLLPMGGGMRQTKGAQD